MARPRQAPEIKRRIPRQARATETASAILEGAAQILEAGGLAAFTTNAVAERAGVSIGTLYQYFADKNEVLLALARQEIELALVEVGRALSGELDPTPAGRARAMIRAMVHAFHGRQRARKAMMQAIISLGRSEEVMAPVAAFIAQQGARREAMPVQAVLTPLQLFVLSRGVMGVIQYAVMEEQPFFKSRAYEDELVRLVMAYVESVIRSAAVPAATER
jgi:AcrR family transcriptional regulator